MKKVIINEDVFGMSNIRMEHTGLGVNIWSKGDGISRNVKHNIPRVKIGTKDGCISISISIEEYPVILSGKDKYINCSPSIKRKLDDAIRYVGRNHDILKQHYEDSIDDEQLFSLLRQRDEYR